MATNAEQTADVLRRRLASAEEDTQQLMQQLEEMGFSTTKEKISERRVIMDTSTQRSNTASPSPYTEQLTSANVNTHMVSTQSDPCAKSQDSQTSSSTINVESSSGKPPKDSKSAKYKPITPFSLRGMSMTGLLEENQTKTANQSSSVSWKLPDNREKTRRQRSESSDRRVNTLFKIILNNEMKKKNPMNYKIVRNNYEIKYIL